MWRGLAPEQLRLPGSEMSVDQRHQELVGGGSASAVPFRAFVELGVLTYA